MTVLETERLRLREFEEGDLDFLTQMLGDEDVMRYYPQRLDRAAALQWLLRQRERYREDGHGLWLVERREDRQPVGQTGIVLQDVENPRVPEIGYMLHKEFWGRGYASEAALACRALAFGALGYTRVISLIRPENKPSQRVAAKVGMTPQRRVMWRDIEHIVYSVARREARVVADRATATRS